MVHLQLLLLLAVMLGGGGLAYAFNNLAIQLFALLLLAVHYRLARRFLAEASRPQLLLVGATLALPLLQLLPLPPAIWTALPGRELVEQSRALAGIDAGSWAPVSLDRARTLVAFCGLVAPATIIVLGHGLQAQEQRRLAVTLLGCIALALTIGVVQLASANSFGLFYPVSASPDILYATFANRNSTGLLLVTGVILAIGLPAGGRQGQGRLALTAAVAALLAIGVVLTQSRSSMVLLLVAPAFLLLRLGWASFAGKASPDRQRKGGVIAVIALLVVLGAILASALYGGRAADSFARFAAMETDRPEMWDDTAYAATRYFPVGSGMGTFDEVFQVHESLEYVSARRAGRAHNDYLELALEAGLAGAVLLGLWLLWVAANTLRQFRHGPEWPGVAGGLVAGCIALQSLLDYPLRNQTMLCVAGLMIVLLAAKREARR
ncbi:O-antigen ligase family protein [Alteraurantiacibacter aquimixticola]|uniref:O-antigen ligase family protein n=1 Tax=Alteraurantiacibacter aquimixticola TaxID=2489173 RepID=UPI00145BF317|nr:O-antigen ligase family protein [Alteraurantiacibacter aquimixticola]